MTYLGDLAGVRTVKQDGAELVASDVLNAKGSLLAVYNAATKEIDLSVNGTTAQAALSRTRFVSSASAVTPATGSVGAPFTTIAAAVTPSVTGDTILIDTGSYGAEALAWATKSLHLAALRPSSSAGDGGVTVASLALTSDASLQAAGLAVTGALSLAGASGCVLGLRRCTVGGAITGALGISSIISCTILSFAGAVLVAHFTTFTSPDTAVTISSGTAYFISCTFSGATPVLDLGTDGTAFMDHFSLRSFLAAGGTITGSGAKIELLDPGVTVQSPAQITANQNNYAPTNWTSSFNTWRLDSNASRDITGFASFVGRRTIINVGTNPIVLKHNSGSSDADKRILIPGGLDLTLLADDAVDILYDTVSTKVRVV